MAETNFAPNLGEFLETTAAPLNVFSGVGAPTGTPPEDSIWIDESTGDFYQYNGGTWTLLFSTGGGGGGGTTIQFSAASDPSGVPTGNARVWVRQDVGKLWVYNTTTAVWDLFLG